MNACTPVYEYEPATWGPAEVEQRIVPPDGWNNPAINKQAPRAPRPIRPEAAESISEETSRPSPSLAAALTEER
jgi:hypothetical protein